jgi:hypothetical protein
VSEQGAPRYQRTFHGLIVSMVVLVIAVVAFWALNNATHHTPTTDQSVDYQHAVAEVQQAGAPLRVVYPSTLPKGWTATSADYTPQSGLGTKPSWSLGVVTSHDSFVGLRLESAPVTALVSTYIDKDASSDGQVRLTTPVGSTWSTFSDAGGDHGYAEEVGDYVLLVYGSADKADMTRFMTSLTTAPLPRS